MGFNPPCKVWWPSAGVATRDVARHWCGAQLPIGDADDLPFDPSNPGPVRVMMFFLDQAKGGMEHINVHTDSLDSGEASMA